MSIDDTDFKIASDQCGGAGNLRIFKKGDSVRLI